VKDLTEQMVKAVVDYPEQVDITEVEGTDSLILEIRVSQDDMGKVIGRSGRIINAMRTIVSAASAAKGAKRTSLEIIEPDEDTISEPEIESDRWSVE
jgi:hypothetical protein